MQEIAARAAYRQAQGTASGSTQRASDYLVGQALDEAERSGEDLHVVWPLQLAGQEPGGAEADGHSKSNSISVPDMAVDGENGGAAAAAGSNDLPGVVAADAVHDWLAMEALL